MKVLEITKNWVDPVKTEETISIQIRNLGEGVLPTWGHVQFGVAQNINKLGLHETQKVIDLTIGKFGLNNLFFVSQHILTSRLNFRQRPIFCPHTTKELAQRNFFPIPHYACNIDPSKIQTWKNRCYLASFQGSYATHPVRAQAAKAISREKQTKVLDTGGWFFERGDQKERSASYTDLLGRSRITLCPRGTGPSSIRFWEALAMGSVPMLIADGLTLPFENQIDWNSFIIRVPESYAPKANNFIPETHTLKQMSEKGMEVYKNNFSNDKLYRSIINKLVTLEVK